MTDFQPFDGASNWTSVVILKKARKRVIPCRITAGRWRGGLSRFRQRNGTVPGCGLGGLLLQGILRAPPIDSRKSNSPWLIRPKSLDADLDRLIGPSDYAAHAGACTGGANGVYWLRILRFCMPGGAAAVREPVRDEQRRPATVERPSSRTCSTRSCDGPTSHAIGPRLRAICSWRKTRCGGRASTSR